MNCSNALASIVSLASLASASVAVASSTGCGFASSPDPQVSPDGGSGPDGAPQGGDAGDLVQLRETSGDEIAPQSSVVCYAPGAQATRDETWVRTFRLADFAPVGADGASVFQVSTVTFWVTSAASARGILVGLGVYAGAYGQATIDPAQIQPLASVPVDVADVASPLPAEQVVVPISAEAQVSEVLLVTVRSPSLQPTGGNLHLGATNAAEAAPGYFYSSACAIPYRSTQALGIVGHLVIEVVGRWLTR